MSAHWPRGLLILVLALGGLVIAPLAAGQPLFPAPAARRPPLPANVCDDEMFDASDSGADEIETWDDAFIAYRRYLRCDISSTRELFVDRMGDLLAYRWNSLPDLLAYIRKDPKFEAFVVEHVTLALPPESLVLIRRNAETSCPAPAKALCRKLAQATQGR